jgi:Tol biopolymer transport system component
MDPVFSNSGDFIIFVMDLDTANSGSAMYKIDADGNNFEQISYSYLNEYHNSFQNPQLLSDDKNIIYFRRIELNEWEIRIFNIETKEDRLIVHGDFNGVYPQINQDGEWIIYWEDGDLFRIHVMIGEIVKITSGNAFGEQFHLNKNTNEIVYRSFNLQNPDMNIAKINLDGTNYLKYAFGGQHPRLSNDGDMIVFNAIGNDEPSIWIADSDGDNLRILTSHYTWDQYAQFFPSDERILFVRSLADIAIFSCDINGEDMKQLSPFDYYSRYAPRFRP